MTRLEREWRAKLGAWTWKLLVRCDLLHWAIGLGADLHSWRNLYPWLHGGVYLGPVAIDMDLTRPPGKCERCGRELTTFTKKWRPTNQWLCPFCKAADANRTAGTTVAEPARGV